MPFGVAFGLAAAEAGLALWQTSAYSLLVFAGSAQFAAVEVLGGGGSIAAATAAGLLLNIRSLAFGVVMGPALQGSWWKRALWSQLMIDETTAIGSAQQEPALRFYGYLYSGVALFLVWNLTTVLGATVVPTTGDLVAEWGIDAAIPAVFLALLWPRLRGSDQRRTAAGGGLLALAATPLVPAGLPIVVAGLAVALGWRRPQGPLPGPSQPSAAEPRPGTPPTPDPGGPPWLPPSS